MDGLAKIKAWRRGEGSLRVVTVDLPRAAEVSAIRRQLGLSQEQFADLMGVSVATLRNWEQGRREPHGSARSLLLVAAREPAAVLKALVASRPRAKLARLGITKKDVAEAVAWSRDRGGKARQ